MQAYWGPVLNYTERKQSMCMWYPDMGVRNTVEIGVYQRIFDLFKAKCGELSMFFTHLNILFFQNPNVEA